MAKVGIVMGSDSDLADHGQRQQNMLDRIRRGL